MINYSRIQNASYLAVAGLEDVDPEDVDLEVVALEVAHLEVVDLEVVDLEVAGLKVAKGPLFARYLLALRTFTQLERVNLTRACVPLV